MNAIGRCKLDQLNYDYEATIKCIKEEDSKKVETTYTLDQRNPSDLTSTHLIATDAVSVRGWVHVLWKFKTTVCLIDLSKYLRLPYLLRLS